MAQLSNIEFKNGKLRFYFSGIVERKGGVYILYTISKDEYKYTQETTGEYIEVDYPYVDLNCPRLFGKYKVFAKAESRPQSAGYDIVDLGSLEKEVQFYAFEKFTKWDNLQKGEIIQSSNGIKADDWNDFTKKINQMREAMGDNQITFTQVKPNDIISAKIYNEAFDAIESKNPKAIRAVSGVTLITTESFKNLAADLNAFADT